MKATQERLAALDSAIDAERSAIVKCEAEKHAIETDIEQAEGAISELREELKGLNNLLDERTKELDNVKKSTSRAARVLDQALKDIAIKVDKYLIFQNSSLITNVYRTMR